MSRLLKLIKETLDEHGPLKSYELARILKEEEKAYTVIDGERAFMNTTALGMEMSGDDQLYKDEDDNWEYRK